MARIGLFTQSLSNFPQQNQGSFQLAEKLVAWRHEVTLITGQSEDAPSHPHIQCLRPFRNWSWIEALRVAPRLVQMAPEILIVIQPQESLGRRLFHPAHILPVILRTLPNIRLACYLHSPMKADSSPSFQELMKNSDHLICSSSFVLQSLDDVRKESWRGHSLMIPVEETLAPNPGLLLSSAEREVLSSLDPNSPFLLFPYGFFRFTDSECFFKLARELKDFKLVMIGPWKNLPKQEGRKLWEQILQQSLQDKLFFVGKSASPNLIQALISRAWGLALFPYELQSGEQEHFAWLCERLDTPALIDAAQSRRAPRTWRPGQNAYVLSEADSFQNFMDLMGFRKKSRRKSPSPEPEVDGSSDRGANLWNRLLAEEGL